MGLKCTCDEHGHGFCPSGTISQYYDITVNKRKQEQVKSDVEVQTYYDIFFTVEAQSSVLKSKQEQIESDVAVQTYFDILFSVRRPTPLSTKVTKSKSRVMSQSRLIMTFFFTVEAQSSVLKSKQE